MAEETDLFAGLGVRASSANAVEKQVLEQVLAPPASEGDVHRGNKDELQPTTAAEEQEYQRQRRHAQTAAQLATAQQELDAIKAACAAEAAVDAEVAARQEEATPAGVGSASDDGPVTVLGGAGANSLESSRSLQRAVLQERLQGLQAECGRLKELLAEAGAATSTVANEVALAGRTAPHRRIGRRLTAAAVEEVRHCLVEDDGLLDEQEPGPTQRVMVETEKDRLVRKGVLTPFDRLEGFERRVQHGTAGRANGGITEGAHQTEGAPERAAPLVLHGPVWLHPGISDLEDTIGRSGQPLRDVMQKASAHTLELVSKRSTIQVLDRSEVPKKDLRSVRHLPSQFWHQAASSKEHPVSQHRQRRASTLPRKRKSSAAKAAAAKARGRKRGRVQDATEQQTDGVAQLGGGTPTKRRQRRVDHAGDAYGGDSGGGGGNISEYLPSDGGGGSGLNGSSGITSGSSDSVSEDGMSALDRDDALSDGEAELDDEDDGVFERRLRRAEIAEAEPDAGGIEGSLDDVAFDGGFKVPGRVYRRLFDYQKTAVKWLWELHNQRAGGILGDEMGLGKTIQVIAFLAGLHHSGMLRPSLVICPATVLRQWMREFRTWYPKLRIVMFHDSAGTAGARKRPSKARLIEKVANSTDGILLTTYDQLRLSRALLLPIHWGYALLDEGHKIRNPDSEVTLVAKQLQTVHRIILSGSPIQNRLSELWSLFDFIFPGKLGTLPVFQAQFSVPIQVGGYTNASQLQVTTAYKCAVILRDLISPYLLRRRKVDVRSNLPKKTEQVLFCTLGKEARSLYRSYLASTEVSDILEGRRHALAGIDILRKICNHPDLLERAKSQNDPDYGNPSRSGKLVVADKVLAHWRGGGHKALVFTQTQQMLDILEKMTIARGYRYHRMDGTTAVSQRMRLMDDFNNNPDVFVFLLTTKVGGLGVNLTGADRVLLFDPDWNPSTDTQARERAWRIGQTRPVTVYRLITAGTVEEKVYHRQIYKNFLTNKVLSDPRQRRFFTARDIHDLFTLADDPADDPDGFARQTETARLFGDLGHDVGVNGGGLPHDDALAAGATAVPRVPKSFASERDGADLALPDSDATALSTSGSRVGVAAVRQRQCGMAVGTADSLLPTAAPPAASPAVADVALPTASGSDNDAHLPAPRSRVGRRGRATGHGPSLAGRGGVSGSCQGRERRAGADDRGAAVAAARATVSASEVAGQQAEGEEADDAKVLRDLFEGTGINSLIDHHKVETANDPETLAVNNEATRIAKAAAEALRRSRAACQAADISTPTWTGRFGAAGSGASDTAAPRRFGAVQNPQLRLPAATGSNSVATELAASQWQFGGAVAGTSGTFAPSSATLLAGIRARKEHIAAEAAANATHFAGTPAAGPQLPGPGTSREAERASLLAGQLASFLTSRGGGAPSGVIVQHFEQEVPPAQMPLFKQVLKQVASLQRRNGNWVLKPEFAVDVPPAAGVSDHAAEGLAVPSAGS